MNSEEQLEKIELSVEQAEKNIKRQEAMQRLYDNKDFQDLILQDYFVDESSRCVLLKSDPAMHSDSNQADVDNQIIAIGMLRQYFHKVHHMGELSRRSLEADKQTREELLREQLEGVDEEHMAEA